MPLFLATPEAAAAATTTPFDFPFETFASQKELAALAAQWPAKRLVAIWNSLTGVEPVESFKSAKTAATRIWERIQSLGETPKAKAERKLKGGAPVAAAAPAKAKATKKAIPEPKPAKGAKRAKKAKAPAAKDAAAPREGSKTAQVVAMLQRKEGATLQEIVTQMGW